MLDLQCFVHVSGYYITVVFEYLEYLGCHFLGSTVYFILNNCTIHNITLLYNFSFVISSANTFLMIYGQVVLGPPGSGKSTYCYALQQYFKIIDRKCIVVNLDPANDNIQYDLFIPFTEDINAISTSQNL